MATIKGTDGPETIEGTSGDDRLLAGGGNDTVYGRGGDDVIAGGEDDDRISGGGGIDAVTYGGLTDSIGVVVNLRDGTASGGDGNDLLFSIENVFGSQFADDVTGDGGANLISGKGGQDILRGGGGDDVLVGGADDDIMSGGQGLDTLYGGRGQDALAGGAGADTFIYQNLGQTRGELIGDLANEDFIDLSGIDADVNTGGDQEFTLVDKFSGQAGELIIRLVVGSDPLISVIRGDVDGDGQKDFQIEVNGDASGYGNFVF